jgi:hypothetical protein
MKIGKIEFVRKHPWWFIALQFTVTLAMHQFEKKVKREYLARQTIAKAAKDL